MHNEENFINENRNRIAEMRKKEKEELRPLACVGYQINGMTDNVFEMIKGMKEKRRELLEAKNFGKEVKSAWKKEYDAGWGKSVFVLEIEKHSEVAKYLPEYKKTRCFAMSGDFNEVSAAEFYRQFVKEEKKKKPDREREENKICKRGKK